MVCYLKYFITCDLHTLFHSIFLPFLSTPPFIVISLFDQSYSLPVIFSFLVLLTFCSSHLIELCSYPIFLYETVYLLISTAVPLTLASLAAARRYRGSKGLRNVAVRCDMISSNRIRLKFKRIVSFDIMGNRHRLNENTFYYLHTAIFLSSRRSLKQVHDDCNIKISNIDQ